MHRIFGPTVYERLARIAHLSRHTNRHGEFEYWVEGSAVYRRGPDHMDYEVFSSVEIEESLDDYSAALLVQGRRARIALVDIPRE